jgi:hypothetical protein
MLFVVMLSVVTLSVVMLSVVMLNVVMLSVVMLSVVMLSVLMLSVVANLYGRNLPPDQFRILTDCANAAVHCSRMALKLYQLMIMSF